MPESLERETKKRGGIEKWRTLKLPSGRYLHVAVTPKAGPRGGHTLASEPQTPKDDESE